MITQIFNNGVSNPNDLTFLADAAQLSEITVVFDSVENRDAFAKQFPKSLKVSSGMMGGFGSNYNEKMPIIRVYTVRAIYKDKVNGTTGPVNEAGEKRIARVHAALTVELNKQ